MRRSLSSCVLIAAFVTAAPTMALDRANTAQKGSLLIFPYIDVSPGKDTIVRIENSQTEPVNVRCVWRNGEMERLVFQQTIGASSPLVLIASSEGFPTDPGPLTGFGPTDRGELKCWAVNNDASSELRWNHLSGSADIFDFESPSSVQRYTAWAVRCVYEAPKPKGKGRRSDHSVDTGECGTTPGLLELDGVEYEACPRTLTLGFSPTGAFGGLYSDSTLYVASCSEDLRQDNDFIFTKLEFDTWKEDGTNYSGAFDCAAEWHETTLEGIDNLPQNFSLALIGNNGRFEVTGVASSACPFPTSDVGLVGVLTTATNNNDMMTNLVGFGEIPGFLAWDTQGPVAEIVAP